MNVQSLPSMSVDAVFRRAENRVEEYELVEGVPRLLPMNGQQRESLPVRHFRPQRESPALRARTSH